MVREILVIADAVVSESTLPDLRLSPKNTSERMGIAAMS